MRKSFTFVLMLLMVGCSGKNISTRDIQPEALPENTALVEADNFSVDGVKHFASLVDASLDRNSFSNVVIRPIGFRLPDEKTEKSMPRTGRSSCRHLRTPRRTCLKVFLCPTRSSLIGS